VGILLYFHIIIIIIDYDTMEKKKDIIINRMVELYSHRIVESRVIRAL
jgi:hypothetical protein